MQITLSHRSLTGAGVPFVSAGEMGRLERSSSAPGVVLWSRPRVGRWGWLPVSQLAPQLGAFALEGQSQAEGRWSPDFLSPWLPLQPPVRPEASSFSSSFPLTAVLPRILLRALAL